MSLEIIPWQVRFATEGIHTKQGWMGGPLMVGVDNEYNYLTGQAFDMGVISAEDAIHYCDEAIKVVEAQETAIRACISILPADTLSPIEVRRISRGLDTFRMVLAEDVPREISRWTEEKTDIAAKAERYALIRKLVSDTPGCIQSEFRKKHPDISSDDLYFAALRGDIRREKKGRSYALFASLIPTYAGLKKS
jgi:hypothetical protein